MSDRATRDRGAAEALGVVLIAPVAIGLALLVVSLARGVDAATIPHNVVYQLRRAA